MGQSSHDGNRYLGVQFGNGIPQPQSARRIMRVDGIIAWSIGSWPISSGYRAERQEPEMQQPARRSDMTPSADQPSLLAPDTSGMNFYRADPALTDLLRIHLPEPLFRHIEPHLDRLGELAGGYLRG